MLEIAPEKVAHVIVRAREVDVKVEAWDEPDDEADANSVLENRGGDATESELRAFIAELNDDERISLVALMWIGRGTYEPAELEEAKETARTEAVNPTEDYLLGVPLLADYLEDGLDRLGISVEDAEEGIL
jgi:hypothetical protein